MHCAIFSIFILFNSYSRFQGIYPTPKIKKVRADRNFVWFFRFCSRSGNLGAVWMRFDGFANSFETFLELWWHFLSTRSRRLVSGFWWFLVQHKVESLLILFLLFLTQFRWVETSENFQWSKKLCFSLPKLQRRRQMYTQNAPEMHPKSGAKPEESDEISIGSNFLNFWSWINSWKSEHNISIFLLFSMF